MIVPEVVPDNNIEVVNVGDIDRTFEPDPIDVVTPVPPFNTGKAVPERVIARVPELVIGEPDILRNAGTEAATEVTVPEVAGAAQVVLKTVAVPSTEALASVHKNIIVPVPTPVMVFVPFIPEGVKPANITESPI